MRRVYFDNAATTPVSEAVIEAMVPVLREHFGNPSSIHAEGRGVRALLETARKSVAQSIGAGTGEIFFTSGGTESNNTAIKCAVRDLGVQRIISSPTEHHCGLHAIQTVERHNGVEVIWLPVDQLGRISIEALETALINSGGKKTLVSLMHANNEIGNMLDIHAVGELCKKHQAIFHSDTVQTMGHYAFDLKTLDIDFITCAAHKFHGPKGVGLLYINGKNKIHPLIHGGGQERNMRAGTENLYGIIGFAKALEIATDNLEQDKAHIQGLKKYLKAQLESSIPGIVFNGDPDGESTYTVLSVGFPQNDKTDMLLFNLDIRNICASGGSACSSGANQGSHVIAALKKEPQSTIRFSFSKYNKIEDIDTLVANLKELL